MATKLNLAEITKDLNANAGKILEESSRVRKNLDMVLRCFDKAVKDWRRTFCDEEGCRGK